MQIYYFSEYGLSKNIASESDSNFVSDKFKNFCKNLNIEQAISSSYHHQNNGKVKACIVIKHTIRNALILIQKYI